MSIAAVIPTTSGRSRPIATISSAKAPVQDGPDDFSDAPVSRSMAEMLWNWSASSSSARP